MYNRLMQFQVPQFIEIEDKIIGPFSWKQFIYMLGGLGLAYIFYKTLPFLIALLLIIPTLSLAGALTFVKINGRPFIFVLEAWFNYAFQSKLYVWKKPEPKKKEEAVSTPNDPAGGLLGNPVPKVSTSKLKDLSWSLDVLDLEKDKSQGQVPKS